MPDLSRILYLVPGFVLGLTLHEFAHAFVAHRLGDPTAKHMGRLTLNPLAHLDPFGSLMLIFAGFGWAKPVPVDASYLRSPRRDMALIAVAGPVSNVMLALLVALLLRLFIAHESPISGVAQGLSVALMIAVQAVWINLVLAIFNLIPLPPLDGSRILAGIVPENWNHGYEQFERVGPMILLGLVVFASLSGVSIFGRLISPVAGPVFDLLMGVALL